MKNLVRSSLVAASFALVLTGAARSAEAEPGYVDFGQLMPSAKGQFVEVNLSPALLKFAAKIAAHQEPDAAELIGNLKRVRVNVVGLDEGNRAGAVEQIESIRRKLAADGWTPVVSVREENDGNNVNVHVKQRSEDAIDGLVVTVIDKKGEAVIVNVVGNITAEQINKVAEKYDIEPLRKIHVKLDHKHHEDDKASAPKSEKEV
jgi:hypothetical protein